MNPIPRELALISFPQLNAGLHRLGLPQCATKAEALAALAVVLERGLITVADIKNAPLTAISKASAALPDELTQVISEVSALQTKATDSLDASHALRTHVLDLTRKRSMRSKALTMAR